MSNFGTPDWGSLPLDVDGLRMVQAVTAALIQQGLSVGRSFDWCSALAPDGECECPQHGTTRCTCQFTVLLVYGCAPQPVTLTIHCRNQRTLAQIVQDATAQPDPALAQHVRTVLVETGWKLLLTRQPTTEVAVTIR